MCNLKEMQIYELRYAISYIESVISCSMNQLAFFREKLSYLEELSDEEFEKDQLMISVAFLENMIDYSGNASDKVNYLNQLKYLKSELNKRKNLKDSSNIEKKSTDNKNLSCGEKCTECPERVFTLDELKKDYNGLNGKPAYISVQGIVFDVTNSDIWKGATHVGNYAGNDLTKEFLDCNYHKKNLQYLIDSVPVVGILR